ncbi:MULTISPECIES: hypothetical protein [Niastella]|uniref:Glycosyltransferase RgtA/B/C/D-like domain-containing protein n=1 Tax=Niastella soli TaxID=2821487 RepID=A0ABS3YLG3_9BACT|nr:hypothetical protein [Niastella soli]MBO9198738.1 hypothetical protein [Niastella soli]
MLHIPSRTPKVFFLILAIFLSISWLVLLIINPVIIAPDSYGYMETAKHLSDPSSSRPILFPLLILITNTLHLKLSIVCYFIQMASLVCFFWFCGPRKNLLSLANLGILIVFLLMPATWSYFGICLTESIIFAVEIWIVIFLSLLFFPARQNSLVSMVLYSLAIALLAITLKPWIMIYVVGCSVLFTVITLFIKAFRAVRKPALVLFIVTIGAFAFSYRYNIDHSSSSANIVYLLANSDRVDDLKARLHEAKDTTTEEARFISLVIDDIQVLQTKYNADPLTAPMEDQKVLKVNDKAYADTINKAFKIAYFQRSKDVINLMNLSVSRYINDTQLGLTCLDICYGPAFKILRKNGVYFALAFFGLTLIVWVIGKRRKGTPLFKRPVSIAGKQLLIFVVILLFTSFFFALFLSISGGIELRRTVLPAVLFQLAAISYLIINRHKLMAAKEDNKPNNA